MKRLILLLTFLMIIIPVFLSGCGERGGNNLSETKGSGAETLEECGIIHEPEFGGVYIKMTIEDFNDLGFEFGDSVTLRFSNGYCLENLPYYNGFYSRTGDPLLIGYPGYDYIKAVISYGDDLWDVAGISDNDKATITLEEKGKFIDIQNARDLHYTDDRGDYESDEVFANFRNIKAGTIREGMLYRSASPCDDQHGRAPYVDRLSKQNKIDHIIDLADDEEKINGYMASEDFESLYFKELYDRGSVSPLAMDMDFNSGRFRNGIKEGMTVIAEKDGPFLIHCTEGKDRTGFFCMLAEALCGASYDEIVDDYMESYHNYYHIDKETDRSRYDIIVSEVLDPMIAAVFNDKETDIKTADLQKAAEQYLKDIGLSDEIISGIRNKLT